LEHFKILQGKLEFHQNKCHSGNAPNTGRQCVKANDQWAQGVAGWPHFAASRRLASRVRSQGGGNKESKVESQWKLNSVAAQPRD
jgi:hypothetical protein